MAARGSDSHDPRRFPTATAKARLIVEASELKTLLERFSARLSSSSVAMVILSRLGPYILPRGI